MYDSLLFQRKIASLQEQLSKLESENTRLIKTNRDLKDSYSSLEKKYKELSARSIEQDCENSDANNGSDGKVSHPVHVMLETDHGAIGMDLNKIAEIQNENRAKQPYKEQKNRVVSNLMSRLWDEDTSSTSSNCPDSQKPSSASSCSQQTENGDDQQFPRLPSYDIPLIEKEDFLCYQEFFRTEIPFREALGKRNPYTGDPVRTSQDYDFYCLCYYLKSKTETHMTEQENLSRAFKQALVSEKLKNEDLWKIINVLSFIVAICIFLIVGIHLFYNS